MFNLTFTTPISLFISLAALAGVTLHDTKIDKLSTALVGIPAIMANTESGSKGISGDLHTHVERVSINNMQSSAPRLAPRLDDKKHMLQKNVPRGGHQFDGYALPLT